MVVRTDHQSLLYDLHLKNMKLRHYCWEEQLQIFNIQLEYKQGQQHTIPDSLSLRLDLKDELEDKTKVATISSIISDLTKEGEWKESTQWNAYFKLVSNQVKVDDIQYQDYTLHNDLLYFKKRIYVLNNTKLQRRIL